MLTIQGKGSWMCRDWIHISRDCVCSSERYRFQIWKPFSLAKIFVCYWNASVLHCLCHPQMFDEFLWSQVSKRGTFGKDFTDQCASSLAFKLFKPWNIGIRNVWYICPFGVWEFEPVHCCFMFAWSFHNEPDMDLIASSKYRKNIPWKLCQKTFLNKYLKNLSKGISTQHTVNQKMKKKMLNIFALMIKGLWMQKWFHSQPETSKYVPCWFIT